MFFVARLVGTYTHNLEQTTRLAIPAKMRAELGKEFMLARSPSGEPCLLVYSFEDWDDVMASVNDQDASEELTFIQRSIYADAEIVSLDKYGRISVPKRFLEAAGLEHEVVLLGTGFHLELWSPEEFEKMQQRIRAVIGEKKIYLKK